MLMASAASADVVLWVTNGTHIGNFARNSFDARTGADDFCNVDLNRPTGYDNTFAFISVDANDEIRDMPSIYEVPTQDRIVRLDGSTVIAVSGWTGDCAGAGTNTQCSLSNINNDQTSTVSFEQIPAGTYTVHATSGEWSWCGEL